MSLEACIVKSSQRDRHNRYIFKEVRRRKANGHFYMVHYVLNYVRWRPQTELLMKSCTNDVQMCDGVAWCSPMPSSFCETLRRVDCFPKNSESCCDFLYHIQLTCQRLQFFFIISSKDDTLYIIYLTFWKQIIPCFHLLYIIAAWNGRLLPWIKKNTSSILAMIHFS